MTGVKNIHIIYMYVFILVHTCPNTVLCPDGVNTRCAKKEAGKKRNIESKDPTPARGSYGSRSRSEFKVNDVDD